MTYYDLMMSANRKLDNDNITLGEYEEMIAPLKREIEPEKSECPWYGNDGKCHFAEQEMDECDDCISRQAVIQIIENKLNPCTDMFKCLEMSEIKEDVERLPSVEPEKCGDCISRQAALNALEALEQDAPSAKHVSAIFDCEDTIKRLPPVEPERKPGIWTHEDTGLWTCGVCGEEVGEMGDEYGAPKYNFCPYCGADMTGRGWKNE